MLSLFKTKVFLSILYPTLIGLFLIICFFFVNTLTKNKLNDLTILREKLATRENNNQSFLLLTASKNAADNTKARLTTLLPITDDLIKLPQDIRALGATVGVNAAIVFGSEQEGSATTPGTISFILSAESPNPQAIINFLQKIESSRYLIRFNKISEGKSGINYKIIANGQIYTQ